MVLSDMVYLEAAASADAEEIRRLLESTLERDKLEGMKHVTAMSSLGEDAGAFFPSVVKNVVVGRCASALAACCHGC